MRNPYNKHYDETDELCVVNTKYELALVMNFMMTFNIDAEAFPYQLTGGKSPFGHNRVLVYKGNLSKAELKEARDSISGMLWVLRIPALANYINDKEL
jgi:hypothetical protein